MKTGSNRGQVLVILALGIVVLLGMAALAIDVGFIYTVRNELQRSADAGALAGASAFKDTGRWSDVPTDPVTVLATDRAKNVASRDIVVQTSLDRDAEVAVSFPTNMRIRVDTWREVSLFFAGVLGVPKRMVTAYAVAEAYPVSRDVQCLVPFGIPLPWNDGDGDGEFDPGESISNPDITKEDCEALGEPTRWDHAIHAIDNTQRNTLLDRNLCQGSLQVLKIGDSNTLIPGNFFGMDFANLVESCPGMEPTHGADFFSYLIAHSCECTFNFDPDDPNDEFPPVPTEPGKMVGPTRVAIAPNKYWGWSPYNPSDNTLGVAYPQDDANPYFYTDIGGTKDWIPGNPPADQDTVMNGDPDAEWVSTSTGGYPQSTRYPWDGGAGDWKYSPRIVRIPIYDPSGTINGGIHSPNKSSGKTSFTPLSFVGFFIEDIQYFPPNSGTVVGRFITVGGFGSGPDTGPTGTPVLNIRLVE